MAALFCGSSGKWSNSGEPEVVRAVGEAGALEELGRVASSTGRYDQAAKHEEEALGARSDHKQAEAHEFLHPMQPMTFSW